MPSPGVIREDPANLPGGVSRLVKRAGADTTLRRIDYAARKDTINARKRAAYQLRKKNRGQKVFITDQAIQKVPLVAPNGGERAQS